MLKAWLHVFFAGEAWNTSFYSTTFREQKHVSRIGFYFIQTSLKRKNPGLAL